MGVRAAAISEPTDQEIARALREQLSTQGIVTVYIEPGAPYQNRFAESFNSRVKDAFTTPEIFRWTKTWG